MLSYDALVQAYGYAKTDASGDAGPSDQRGWRERARDSAQRLREQIYEMDLGAERNQQALFHVEEVKANQEGQKPTREEQGGARRSKEE